MCMSETLPTSSAPAKSSKNDDRRAILLGKPDSDVTAATTAMWTISSDSSTASSSSNDNDDTTMDQPSVTQNVDVWASTPDVYLPLSHDVSANWLGYSITGGAYWKQAAVALVHTVPLVLFSLQFPFLLAPDSAPKLYKQAGYHYVDSPGEEWAGFDNTAWTYATDYGLAVVMAALISSSNWSLRSNSASALRNRAALLLGMYCLSVSAGGISHHFFLTVDQRNSWQFRALWTLCVGTVTIASAFLGMSATCVHRHMQQHLADHKPKTAVAWSSLSTLRRLPIIPEFVWIVSGLLVTAVCLAGGISFHRPACDIFIAGITQSPSSLYLTLYFWCIDDFVSSKIKWMGSFCFLMNAPLLPLYPILVRYTPLTLPAINAIYHSYLTCSWTMQGLCLLHVQERMEAQAVKEYRTR